MKRYYGENKDMKIQKWWLLSTYNLSENISYTWTHGSSINTILCEPKQCQKSLSYVQSVKSTQMRFMTDY